MSSIMTIDRTETIIDHVLKKSPPKVSRLSKIYLSLSDFHLIFCTMEKIMNKILETQQKPCTVTLTLLVFLAGLPPPVKH